MKSTNRVTSGSMRILGNIVDINGTRAFHLQKVCVGHINLMKDISSHLAPDLAV